MRVFDARAPVPGWVLPALPGSAARYFSGQRLGSGWAARGQHLSFMVASMEDHPDLFKSLDHDWQHFVRRRDVRDNCRRWATQDGDLAGLVTPELLLAGCQDRLDPAAGNGVMAGLLRRRDPVAQRVALQALIPGIIVRTGKVWRRHRHGPWGCIWELHVDAVGFVTEHLAAADGHRAWPANSALRYMTRRLGAVADLWRAAPAPVGDLADQLIDTTAVAGAVTSLEALAATLVDQVRSGVVGREEAGHVYAYRVLGLTSREIATASGRSFDASRQYRVRAEHRVLEAIQ